jgi:hypothetical protein
MVEIAEKLAAAYERVIKFFESKGLVDPKKRAELVDLMFDVIKGHAVNTEFMQVDAARGAKNAMKKVSESVDKGERGGTGYSKRRGRSQSSPLPSKRRGCTRP